MINYQKTGKKLVITADLDGTELSSSGKNITLATTNGFESVPDSPVKVSLNVIVKPNLRSQV